MPGYGYDMDVIDYYLSMEVMGSGGYVRVDYGLTWYWIFLRIVGIWRDYLGMRRWKFL